MTEYIFPVLNLLLFAYLIIRMRGNAQSGTNGNSDELPKWAEEQIAEGKAMNTELNASLKAVQDELNRLQIQSATEKATLETALQSAREKLESVEKMHTQQKAEEEKSKEAMKNEFKVLAESILEEKNLGHSG